MLINCSYVPIYGLKIDQQVYKEVITKRIECHVGQVFIFVNVFDPWNPFKYRPIKNARNIANAEVDRDSLLQLILCFVI